MNDAVLIPSTADGDQVVKSAMDNGSEDNSAICSHYRGFCCNILSCSVDKTVLKSSHSF